MNKRKYTRSQDRDRREIVIKRHSRKEFSVIENDQILYLSSDFDLCVDFLEKELKKDNPTEQRLMA